jgi:hypothetical protein
VLQSAKYDSGQLIEWNGKPKRHALQELLASAGISADTRDRLLSYHDDMWFQTVQLQPANDPAQLQYLELRIDRQWTGVGIWQFRNQSDATRLSVVQINFLQHKGVGPFIVVLEHALAHSETLVWRDGALRLEKIYRLETGK